MRAFCAGANGHIEFHGHTAIVRRGEELCAHKLGAKEAGYAEEDAGEEYGLAVTNGLVNHTTIPCIEFIEHTLNG